MRKLNIDVENEEGKKESFTFTALKASEARAIRKMENSKEERKRNKKREDIRKKEENGEVITDKEQDFLDECEDVSIERLMRIIRMSLAKKHKEYELLKDEQENKKINDKLEDMFDFNTLSLLAEFAISGTVSKQEEITVIEDITIG